jgi:hypothetical protein
LWSDGARRAPDPGAAGLVVEPRELGAGKYASDVARLGGVEHRECHAVERDRVRSAFDRHRGIAHRVVVPAHVSHLRAELAVALEERLVLLGATGVGEITLHHDRVRVERRHLAHDGAVHHERVRHVARLSAEDGPDRVGRGVAGAAALSLPEVHIVGGGDGREQAPGG